MKIGPMHDIMAQNDSIRELQKKFYASSSKFLAFEFLSKESLKKVDDLVNSFTSDLAFNIQYPQGSVERYIFVLRYLNDPKKSKEMATFDEKMLFFIRLVDPELLVYRYYLVNNFTATKKDGKRDIEKDEQNSIEGAALIKAIEEAIGVLDAQLIIFERTYFTKVLKPKTFLSHIKRDFSTPFLDSLKAIESFEHTKYAEYELIAENAQHYVEHCEHPENPNATCFNMENFGESLNLTHLRHKAIFFILVCDPELRALRISEEESTMQKIEDRCRSEVGYYHPELLRVEKLFHKRFCPDKRISFWSEQH